MKEQRRVYEALAKIAEPQKEELSSERLELSFIGKVEDAIDEQLQLLKTMQKAQGEVAKAVLVMIPASKKLEAWDKKAEKLINEAKEVAKEYKIFYKDIKGIDTLEKRLPLSEDWIKVALRYSKAL